MLPKLFGSSKKSSESNAKIGKSIERSMPLARVTDGTDAKKSDTFGKKLANFAAKFTISSAIRAIDDQESYVESEQQVRENEKRKNNQSSGSGPSNGGASSIEAFEKLATPLSRLVSIMNDIRENVSQITSIIKSDSVQEQQENQSESKDSSSVRKSPVANYADNIKYTFAYNADIQKAAGQNQDGQLMKASSAGESSTSAYVQNEKETKDNQIDSFGSKAIEQLSELFRNAFEKMKSEDKGSESNSSGIVPPVFNPFKKSPKPIQTGKSTQRAKPPQPRGPDGRFIKSPPPAKPANLFQRMGSGMAKAAGNSAGLLKGAGKVAGAAAIPILSWMEYDRRRNEGQEQKDAAIGTAGYAAGGIAGGIAGAQGGAIVGGGLGTLLGPAGTVAGAAAGGVIGGIGGAIAGSGIGGWLADKANDVFAPKNANETMNETLDLVALEKRKIKKEAESRLQSQMTPPIISAPTTNSQVSNQNVNLAPNTTPIRGVRGSLDLQKY